MTRQRGEPGESWYRIVGATDGGATRIDIYDIIGEWGVSARDFLFELGEVGGPVEVHINSPGGDIFDAYAIYNALASRPNVTTVVDGVAASAASVIAMAGEQREMARASQLMIHNAWAPMTGGGSEDLRHMAERLDMVTQQIAQVYADTAGGDASYWLELMQAETWFTPQQALDAGLITGILSTARQMAAATSAVVAPGTVAAVAPGTAEPEPEPEPTSEQPPEATEDPPPGDDAAPDQAPQPEGLSHAPSGSPVPTSSGTKERNTEMPEQDALTIEARRSRLGDISNRLTEIHAQYPAATLPTDVQAEWDQLVTEQSDHTGALSAVDTRSAVLAQVHAGRPQSHEQVPPASAPASVSSGGAPAAHLSRDIYNLAEIRQQARSAEDLPRLYKENAIRAIDVARFPGSKREETQERVSGLLDKVIEDVPGTLARRILATGSPGYKQAFGRALSAGNPGALGSTDARVLALGESDTGSYAVPFELDPTVLLTSDGAINPLRAISRVVQITGKEYDLVTSAGVTVSRKAEFAAETDNAPTLAQPTVKPERVSGFIPFSVEIEGDWSALQAEMMMLLRDAKDIEEATAFTLGTGTPPDASGVVSTLDSGSNVAGSSGALNAADPQKLEEALAPRFRTNASYMGSKTTLNAYRTLLIAAGYQYDAYVQATQGTPRQLFGYNAYECSDMVSTHATADTPLIFGDFKRGFIIIDRVGMNMELVPHLFGAAQGQYPTGRRGYFAWWRNNSRVLIDNAFRLLAVA